jgi:NADPH:quinone reductase-like Zn-dependent oxidoreductase
MTGFGEDAAVTEVPTPEAGAGAARVRVRAAALNRVDFALAAGMLQGMMEYEFPIVLGRDFAGAVDAVGDDITALAAGDEVFGFVPSGPPLHDGAIAEYVVVPAASLVASPEGVDVTAAAALPLAAATAHAAVEAVDPRPDSTVLIAGATGGVGSFAVQLAAQRGATVLASGTEDDAGRLTRLGAAAVVARGDRLTEHVRAEHSDGVDALIDLVSYSPDGLAPLSELVRDGGRVASPLGAADADALAGRGIEAANEFGAPTPDLLAAFAVRVASGELEVDVEEVAPLDRSPELLRRFATGPVRGKLVVEVAG